MSNLDLIRNKIEKTISNRMSYVSISVKPEIPVKSGFKLILYYNTYIHKNFRIDWVETLGAFRVDPEIMHRHDFRLPVGSQNRK